MSDEEQYKENIRLWLESAEEDWDFAVEIWHSSTHLHNALFFAQMALEKTLKALHYCLKKDHPLYIHDLLILAEKAGLETNGSQKSDLEEITSFNVSARYEDYKKSLRTRATKEFTDKWMKKSENLRNYFLSLFK